ncbi:MAG: hypothetical protein HOP30_21665 [Cyclobacteriaceae bacterium]|nr:hypothetical protein [Cyclobacteriaceae bacterium]
MINVNRYDIDYTKIVTDRIPQELQEAEHVNWVYRLISPIVYVYNQLILFRLSILYKLSITPQVVYLEKMLNDRYDNALRRIYIVDGKTFDPFYIYTRAEVRPKYFYTRAEVSKPKNYIYTRGETSLQTYDFVVFVPVAVTLNAREMNSLIMSYKLAGKLFTIQTI